MTEVVPYGTVVSPDGLVFAATEAEGERQCVCVLVVVCGGGDDGDGGEQSLL